MKLILKLFSGLLALSLAFPQAPAAEKRSPVVVELFTSEGCSSCPPADLLLTRLEQQQPVAGAEIVALGQHVDYWDNLGWRDLFSSPLFTARQERYAGAFRKESAYTPQMVIDGRVEFVGSDTRRAVAAINEAARASKATVSLTPHAAGPRQIALQIRVDDVPALAARDSAEVLLAITEDSLQSNVSSGENSGRKLVHNAVVRDLKSIGPVAPQQSPSCAAQPVVKILGGWKRENLRAVVVVQERNSRRVLGAAQVRLDRD